MKITLIFMCFEIGEKYLIKPVNFYTDNKNISTDINVNETKINVTQLIFLILVSSPMVSCARRC